MAWIESADNPWHVRLLDVRPITLNMTSFSQNPACATNALSFASEDGLGFVGQPPRSSRSNDVTLRFPVDGFLADGVLYRPSGMDQKWALFFHRKQIICVRSWLREVFAIAHVERDTDAIVVNRIDGMIAEEDEDPSLASRSFDFLVRSHALGMVEPAPLPPGKEMDPEQAALWCRSRYGDRALFATQQEIPRREPDRPLRTFSLLHIAAARGDIPAIERHLAAGWPVDLRDLHVDMPLHWAIASGDTQILALLLEHGSPVNARNERGLTPLHHAAADGRLDAARMLLDRGADPDLVSVDGQTPLSMARGGNHQEIASLLESYSTDGTSAD